MSNPPPIVDWIAVGVAGVAALIALFAFCDSRKTNKRATELDARLVSIEEARNERELKPNVTTSKVELFSYADAYSLTVNLTNRSKSAVHIFAFEAKSKDGKRLAFGDTDLIIRSEESLKDHIFKFTRAFADNSPEAQKEWAIDTPIEEYGNAWLLTVNEVSLYYQYSETGDTNYSLNYQPLDVEPGRVMFWQRKNHIRRFNALHPRREDSIEAVDEEL